ncbi:MAG: M2 family metallopeptidase [Vicinamibacterales bacterium]
MTAASVRVFAAALLVGSLHVACGSPTPPEATRVDAEQARSFLATVDDTLTRLWIAGNQAGWIAQTYITGDTEAVDARTNQEVIAAQARFAKESTRFDGVQVSPDERRQLDLLKLSLVMAAPSPPSEAEELTRIASRLRATYGKGRFCPEPSRPDRCLNIDDVTRIMASSRDEAELRRVWEGWHTIAIPMRQDYSRFVELSNAGARELGFADTGAMWRAKYDMPPDALTQELDRLWEQVKPLYLQLHAYVRMKLRQRYGDLVPEAGPIPAHLLGNIWAQDWSNLQPLVEPPGARAGYSLTDVLVRRKTSALDMVRYGERFYTSLGFVPLPPTFWERSQFVRPRDRDVVCHASAWDIDLKDDVRIKMCIQPTAEDFSTIHHELGHNFYQRAYMKQPVLFRDSANDGFHEAIGDTIALSVTPEYLVEIGLLDRAPHASSDIGILLSRALDKVAFLPFGLLIDQWRWRVFAGKVSPDDYNKAWWDLRRTYQGVAPSTSRDEQFFDPGAKYHVPDNTPYTRYFLASILQFQFHRALSETAGCTRPLHRCSIFGSRTAGHRLQTALEMGLSKPWPDALEALTGTRQMDGSAMVDYFAPLQQWLTVQTQGQPLGW